MRPREVYDGAIPSGNSVAALNLVRLGRITAENALEERAEALMRAFSSQVSSAPLAHSYLMTALDFAVGPSHEIVIAGEPGAEDTETLLRALRSEYLPNKVVLLRPSTGNIAQIAPYTESQTSRDGRATAYVCQNFACQLPTTDPEEMLSQIRDGLLSGGE
jgi:hypothetical protein